MVALKDRKSLEIQVTLGARDSRRVEGLLRKPVKSFGNGSTWELITEGSCKAGTAAIHSGIQHGCIKCLGTQCDKECAQCKFSITHGKLGMLMTLPLLRALQLVVVTLEKELFGQWWTSALKGHAEIDLHTVPGYDPPPFDPTTYRM